MAIVVESYTNDYALNDADTTLAPAVPAGVADGDLLVAIAACVNTVSAPDANWTQVLSYSAANIHVKAWTKIANNESGSYAFTTPTYSRSNLTLLRVTGADTAVALSGDATSDGTWDNSTACPAITTSVAGSMIVWIAGISYAIGSATTSINRSPNAAQVCSLKGNAYCELLSIFAEVIAGTGEQSGCIITSNAVNIKTGAGMLITPASATAGLPAILSSQFRRRYQ